MMGMMTLVRVLPPEVYDQIMEMKSKEQEGNKDGKAKPSHEHKH